MATTYDKFVQFVFGAEGKPGIDPDDPGGYTTWYGIIQQDVTDYDEAHGTAVRNVRDISQSDALTILGYLYWQKGRAGLPAPSTIVDPALAIVLADTAVNPISGIWTRVANIMALPTLSQHDKALYIINARKEEYAAHANPKFRQGLENRMDALKAYVQNLTPPTPHPAGAK